MDLLRNIFKGDKVVWIIFLALCLISITEVFSAASSLSYRSGDYWEPITKHSIYLLIGTLIVVLIHNVNCKKFQIIPIVFLPLSAGMLLFVMIAGFVSGDRVNGAARWLNFMGIQFQPSELAKMAVITVTAFILSRGQTEEGASPSAYKYILYIAGGVCLLILPENYSTAALLFVTVYAMMIIGRIPRKKLFQLGGTLGILACMFASFLYYTPDDTLNKVPMGHRFTTVKHRLFDFASQKKVPAAKFDIDGDAQVAHARIALATSHVVGKGPGNSVERDFLSQAFSDFIFAIIIEELGLIGGIVVVFLYILLLIRAGRIARKCTTSFPAFLVIGVALMLVIQASFNMMVAVGLAPVTGQPLPLISKGGTSTFINCVYIGMILSVSRYVQEEEERRNHDAQIPMAIGVGASDSDSNADIAPVDELMDNDSDFE